MTKDPNPREFAELEAAFLEARRLEPAVREQWLAHRFPDQPHLIDYVRRLLDRDNTSETIFREVGREAERLFAAAAQPPRIDGFEILEVIGRGGMSTVYAAEQANPHRIVAIKILEPHRQGPEEFARLLREADVLARLQHPNIARIIAAGRTLDDRPYLAMERVDGRRLDTWLREEAPRLDRRIDLLLRVCSAVEHAHQRGVIHRDLKPSNILVEENDEAKVLDFGIAWLIEQPTGSAAGSDSGSRSSERSGTLPYMSPEQLEGDPAKIDTRSDVYGLGALAYELFSGRPPYDVQRLGTTEAIRKIEATPPRRLSELDPRLAGDLEAIVARAMHREVGSRYPSATALADDLLRHRRHLPVNARRATAGYVLTRFVRRHAATSCAVLVSVLGIAGGLALSLVSLKEVRSAESIARQQAATAVELGDRLTRLLTTADDSVLSPTVSFHDLLMLGRERLRDELPSSPRARQLLLMALGRAMLSVAENQHALGLFDEAAALDDPSLRDEDTRAALLLGRVRALVMLDRVDDARAAVGEYEALGIPIPTPTAYVLAITRFLQFEAAAGNRDSVARKLLELEALERDPQQGDIARLMRSAVLFRRADAALRDGQTDEGGRLLRDATQAKLTAVGSTSPLIVLELLGGSLMFGPGGIDRTQLPAERDRYKLGRELQDQKRWPELEVHARATLDSLAGESTPRLDVRLPAMRQLAFAQYGLGRENEAIAIAREMVSLASQRFGPKSLEATMARDLLAEFAHGIDDHDLVIATCEEALEQLRGQSDRPRLQGRFLERKGLHLLAQNRLEEAKTALDDSRSLLDALGMSVAAIDKALAEIAARRR
ncbi:MAG: protein kinase [Planctomycetota bacterium]